MTEHANDMIRRLPAAFDAEAAGDLTMTVQYMIEHPMYVSIAAGRCRVHDGIADAPDVTVRVRDRHLIRLMTGRMRGFTAFVTGRVKVEGNYRLAGRLPTIFDRRRLVD